MKPTWKIAAMGALRGVFVLAIIVLVIACLVLLGTMLHFFFLAVLGEKREELGWFGLAALLISAVIGAVRGVERHQNRMKALDKVVNGGEASQ